MFLVHMDLSPQTAFSVDVKGTLSTNHLKCVICVSCFLSALCVHCAVCVLEISPSSAVAGGYRMFLHSSACLNAYAFDLKPPSKIGLPAPSPDLFSLLDRLRGAGLHTLGNKHVEYDGFCCCG